MCFYRLQSHRLKCFLFLSYTMANTCKEQVLVEKDLLNF